MVIRFSIVCMLALSQCALANLRYEEGLARDYRDDRLLYREQHLIRSRDGQTVERQVLYLCADGTPFARKFVDYRRSRLAPEFRFEDQRVDYREGLRSSGSPQIWSDEPNAPERSAALEAEQQLVVDAGFDEFVRQHWQPLLAGEAKPFSFAVPARLDSYNFKLRKVGLVDIDGETGVIFRLRLGSLLGWLLPHIDVVYGQQSQRLMRFEGLSNLRLDGGAEQAKVRINFPQSTKTAEEAQWQQWQTLALKRCAISG